MFRVKAIQVPLLNQEILCSLNKKKPGKLSEPVILS